MWPVVLKIGNFLTKIPEKLLLPTIGAGHSGM